MFSIPVRLLLIEHNPETARWIAALVRNFPNGGFELVHETALAEGIRRLEQDERIGAVLLDPVMPDSPDLAAFFKLRDLEFNVPILILARAEEEGLAVKAVQEGAQDYVIRGEVQPAPLQRSIRNAIERHQLQSELLSTSLVDPLTGLYNRRGFFKLVRQEMKTADRLNHGLLLLYMDLDNLQGINDEFGLPEGDRALARFGEIVRRTFRASDIPGRIGGDEFALLALNADQDAERVVARLRQAVDEHNADLSAAHRLSVSVGFVRYRKGVSETVESLLEQADAMLFREKKLKRTRI